MIALGILGGGLLYLDQFRDNLLTQRLQELKTQSSIIAAAVGETASSGPDAVDIEVKEARQILGRLVGKSTIRARLFSVEGRLVADSRFMFLGNSVFREELPPPDAEQPMEQQVSNAVDRLVEFFRPTEPRPIYRERADQSALDYEEVVGALKGREETMLRQLEDNLVHLSVAAPVQRFRRVLGALMVTTDSAQIEAIVRNERLTILRVFGVSLAVTLLLSFFLASTIARPIRRLSRAADRVAGGVGRQVSLPDFSARHDEIGDLSRSLAAMTGALYRQIDAIEAFAADVAHELKNPLSSLRSAVESLDRTSNPEMQRRLFDIINEDVIRLDRLITDISEASRVDAELSRSEMEAVDLTALINTLVATYHSTLPQGRVRFEVKKPAADLIVLGFEQRLGQVIRNIIDNAVSFSPPGGLICISIMRHGGYARVKIEDEGPGLPPSGRKAIFNRFYSERPPTEAFGTHSGLGLSISKQIIEAHYGRIRAENRVDDAAPKHSDSNGGQTATGARFVIDLPA